MTVTAEVQESNGALDADSIKLTTQLNLGGRNFMQPYLAQRIAQTHSNIRRQTSRRNQTSTTNSSSSSKSATTSSSVSSSEEDIGSSSGSPTTKPALAALQHPLSQQLPQQEKQQALGGYLHVTTHAWCSYAPLTHPQKNTYIFSDLESLQDTKCICRECRPKGGLSWPGPRHTPKLFVRHYTDVDVSRWHMGVHILFAALD